MFFYLTSRGRQDCSGGSSLLLMLVHVHVLVLVLFDFSSSGRDCRGSLLLVLVYVLVLVLMLVLVLVGVSSSSLERFHVVVQCGRKVAGRTVSVNSFVHFSFERYSYRCTNYPNFVTCKRQRFRLFPWHTRHPAPSSPSRRPIF